jgi:hypothetical protein
VLLVETTNELVAAIGIQPCATADAAMAAGTDSKLYSGGFESLSL